MRLLSFISSVWLPESSDVVDNFVLKQFFWSFFRGIVVLPMVIIGFWIVSFRHPVSVIVPVLLL